MAYQDLDISVLNYFPCRYGNSKLLFRGPKKDVAGKYAAFVGGTETYGKYVETPFTDLIEGELGWTTVNLGCVNAGMDVFHCDGAVMDLCAGAKVTVLQMGGAQNMSNRFYAVHPRRNDRFVRASPLLTKLYPDVDFTEFNFTGHLLKSLEARSVENFAIVRQELKKAWVARMKAMIQQISGDVVLLWMADHSLDDEERCNLVEQQHVFVDRSMVDEVRTHVSEIVEVVGTSEQIEQGYMQMRFSELEALSAQEMLGPVVHKRVAGALSEVLMKYV